MLQLGKAPILSRFNSLISFNLSSPISPNADQPRTPFSRIVYPDAIYIPSDNSPPVQDRAQIVGEDVTVHFKEHSYPWHVRGRAVKFRVIQVARNAGETQILVEFLDLTRTWYPLHVISAINVWRSNLAV